MTNIKIYKQIPPEAMDIRIRVFVDEQGFVDDIEDIDAVATHFVAFIDGTAVGTCRTFEQQSGSYILGRMAVLKEYRNAGIGAKLIREAEEEIKRMGGNRILIHAQLHAKGFYEFCGYTAYGELEYEQDKPHVWLKKQL